MATASPAAKKSIKPLPFPSSIPGQDPNLPTGVWDPKWQKADVAKRIAQNVFTDLGFQLPEFPKLDLVDAAKLPKLAADRTEARLFAVTEAPIEGTSNKLKGGSYGELFREYDFGKEIGKQYFHAQGVVFGVESTGRYFLRSVVGRLGGMDNGNKAVLVMQFLDQADQAIGGVVWHGQLDFEPEKQVLVAGRSDQLKAAFAKLAKIRISFESTPGK